MSVRTHVLPIEKLDRVAVSIADIVILLGSDETGLRVRVNALVDDFLVGQLRPDVRILTGLNELPSEIIGELIFDSGGLWRLHHMDEGYVFSFTSPALGPTPYKVASFNCDFTVGDVCLHRPFFTDGEPVNPLEYPLDELLMVNLLARGRGAEIHACGAVDSAGNGHLFVGQSGAGKTTIAWLLDKAGGMTILSDDRIIVRKLEGTMWMYGTPWHSEARFASPARAPLAGIYLLARGPKNELALERPTKAVGRLFACSFPLFYDPEALNFTLGFLDDILKTVPCYELKFVPDEKVVDFLNERLG